MLITNLIRIGNSNIYKVFVDEIFYANLLDETIVKEHIIIGSEIEKSILDSICFEGQKKVALEKAIKLLGTYSKTKKQLTDYLLEKGYVGQVINYVLEKLEDYHYLDDLAYAKSYINSNKDKKGKKAIEFALKEKGISQEIIYEVIGEISDQKQAIKILAEKYLKNKEKNIKTKQKLFSHLAGKGFSFDQINVVINELLNN